MSDFKSFPMNKKFRTGLHFVAWMLVLSVPLSSWIAWDVYHDPHRLMHKDLPALFSFLGVFNGMFVLIAMFIVFQRIRLDLAAQKVHYANVDTFHLWRDIDVRNIQAVHFKFAHHMIVDELHLIVRSPEAGGSQRVVILRDSRFTRLSGEGPSPMLSEIMDFINAQKLQRQPSDVYFSRE